MKPLIISSLIAVLFLTVNTSAQFRWEQTNGPYGGISHIIVSDISGNLYGGGIGGIYFSADNGGSWQFSRLDSLPFSVLTIEFGGKDTIYAGTSTHFYRSFDNMKTWEKIDGVPGSDESKIAVHPLNGHLYAVGSEGLYKSTDKGLTWTLLIDTNLTISLLKILSSGEIFLAYKHGSLMRSVDDGLNWISVYDPPLRYSATALAEDSKGNIYAAFDGLFISSDKGDNWTRISFEADISQIITDDQNNLYAVLRDILIYSADNGKSWNRLYLRQSNGLLRNAVVTKNKHIFLYVEYIGLLRSIDHGFSWEAVGFPLSRVLDIVVNKENEIIVCTNDYGPYLSSDQGESWHLINFPSEWPFVSYVSLFTGGSSLYLSAFAWLWISTDKGFSWEHRNLAPDAFMLTNGGRIIIAINYNDFYSDDNGVTWTTYTGLENFLPWTTYAQSPPSTLYICRDSTIMISSDDGETWSKTVLHTNESIIAMKADEKGVLYIGTYNGIYKSEDLENWTDIGRGLPAGGKMSIDTYKEVGIICKVEDSLIFVSSNGGAEWERIEGWDTFIYKAVVDTAGYIYAATQSSGVFRSNKPLKVYTGVAPDKSVNFSLSQNYPNPFNSVTTIRYSIYVKSHVELKVIDVLGREVSTLINTEQNAGEYSVPFNASTLTSGVYVYSLKAGNYRNSKKLILLK